MVDLNATAGTARTRAHTLRDKRALIRTYEGTQLLLPDATPGVNVLPHNTTHLGTVQELHGLTADGAPAHAPAAKYLRRRQKSKYEWQQGATICDKARARRVDMQRLKRILLDQTAARRRAERKTRFRRTAAAAAAKPGEGGPAGVKMGALDKAVEKELRGLLADADCSASRAGAIDRALTLGEAKLHLDETRSQKVERLAKPRYIKKMPWNEGYVGSPDYQFDQIAWACNLRSFDWERELKARKAAAIKALSDQPAAPPSEKHHHDAKIRATSPPMPQRRGVEEWVDGVAVAAAARRAPKRRQHQHQHVPTRALTAQERAVLDWVGATGDNVPFTFQPRPPPAVPKARVSPPRAQSARGMHGRDGTSAVDTTSRPGSAAAFTAPARPPRERPRTAGHSRSGGSLRKMIVTVADRCMDADSVRVAHEW